MHRRAIAAEREADKSLIKSLDERHVEAHADPKFWHTLYLIRVKGNFHLIEGTVDAG